MEAGKRKLALFSSSRARLLWFSSRRAVECYANHFCGNGIKGPMMNSRVSGTGSGMVCTRRHGGGGGGGLDAVTRSASMVFPSLRLWNLSV